MNINAPYSFNLTDNDRIAGSKIPDSPLSTSVLPQKPVIRIIISLNPIFGDFFEMSEELKCFVPDYDYFLFDLSEMSEEQIKGEIRLRVGFWLFKYIQDEALRHELPRILSLIAQLTQKETALQYLETVLRYLFRGSDKITSEVRSVYPHIFMNPS